jgi:glutaredoxin
MDREELTQKVAALLLEVERMHGTAFPERERSDPDWALFYAQVMKPRIRELLGRESPCVELVRVLLDADEEHEALSPDAPWHGFFAHYLVERCVGTENETLALYYYPSCFFCRRVTSVIERLGIQVELRDILKVPRHREELVAARGRQTVPVLRCTDARGHDRWMPESRDIVAYLERRFGKAHP